MLLRKDAKIALLKRVPLFSHCNKKQLAAIASLADLTKLPTSTLLIQAPDLKTSIIRAMGERLQPLDI